MKKLGITFTTIILMVVAFNTHASFAATIEGYVYGIVQDSMGIDTVALDSATVHGVRADSMQQFTVHTNDNGYYSAQHLENGQWYVTASHVGFTPQTKQWYIPNPSQYLNFYLWDSK
jgi:hypothetical protein